MGLCDISVVSGVVMVTESLSEYFIGSCLLKYIAKEVIYEDLFTRNI